MSDKLILYKKKQKLKKDAYNDGTINADSL